MQTSPEKLSRKFRAAVLVGDHLRTGELAAEYISAFEQAWLLLPESERAVSPLPQQALELLAWAREMAIVQRALDAEQLAVVEKAIRYQPAGLPEPRSRAIQVRI
jgi:hypothetical protein